MRGSAPEAAPALREGGGGGLVLPSLPRARPEGAGAVLGAGRDPGSGWPGSKGRHKRVLPSGADRSTHHSGSCWIYVFSLDIH